MPLRDHFRPPLDGKRHWEGLHSGWPMMIVADLRRKLPRRYFAEPGVHVGATVEIDVATFQDEDSWPTMAGNGNGSDGGVATAIWAPPRPTMSVMTDLPMQDLFEVLVYDEKDRTRLVAAVEIVSPANKDRPEHRKVFAAKCASLLRERVSVVIVDVVTTRLPNLYAEMLDLIGQTDAGLGPQPPGQYAVACRVTKLEKDWRLETWLTPLVVGQPLPTMPLWLADNLAIPLELENSYEQTCSILRIP